MLFVIISANAECAVRGSVDRAGLDLMFCFAASSLKLQANCDVGAGDVLRAHSHCMSDRVGLDPMSCFAAACF